MKVPETNAFSNYFCQHYAKGKFLLIFSGLPQCYCLCQLIDGFVAVTIH